MLCADEGADRNKIIPKPWCRADEPKSRLRRPAIDVASYDHPILPQSLSPAKEIRKKAREERRRQSALEDSEPCGLRPRTVFTNCDQCAGKSTDRLKIIPLMLRTKSGLVKNNYSRISLSGTPKRHSNSPA